MQGLWAGLCRASAAAACGGAGPGPAVRGSASQRMPTCMAPSSPVRSGRGDDRRPRGGVDCLRHGARLCAPSCTDAPLAGVGVGHAGGCGGGRDPPPGGVRGAPTDRAQAVPPYFLGLLAEASGQAGQPEAGVAVLTEAVTLGRDEERWWGGGVSAPGELLLQPPSPMWPGGGLFQQALDVARRQQAKALSCAPR